MPGWPRSSLPTLSRQRWRLRLRGSRQRQRSGPNGRQPQRGRPRRRRRRPSRPGSGQATVRGVVPRTLCAGGSWRKRRRNAPRVRQPMRARRGRMGARWCRAPALAPPARLTLPPSAPRAHGGCTWPRRLARRRGKSRTRLPMRRRVLHPRDNWGGSARTTLTMLGAEKPALFWPVAVRRRSVRGWQKRSRRWWRRF